MKTVFINGILLDGSKFMKEQTGKRIFVNNGRIEKITNVGSSLQGYQIYDLRGLYIMPGLINMHVHLPATGRPKKIQADPVKLVNLIKKYPLIKKMCTNICVNTAKSELFSGVTTIRTVGGVLDYDSIIRDRINEGAIIGPNILASNMAISVPNGHMAGSLAYIAHTPKEASDYVDRIGETNPDLIKLMITGGVMDATKKGEPGVLRMQPELVKAACERAHEKGYYVAAHVESTEGVRVALENGVDSIEHGALIDDSLIELFKERKASLITTISPALIYALLDKKISHATDIQKYNGNIVFEGIISCAKACLTAGIPVGLGTDTGCPYTTHYDMWRELYYFHKYCNVTPAYALHTATLENATIAGIENETGSIAVGKRADMIVTKRNPLKDLTALRNVKTIIINGKIIEQPKLKKYKKVENVLDQFL